MAETSFFGGRHSASVGLQSRHAQYPGAAPAEGFCRIALVDPASGVYSVLSRVSNALATSDKAPWADSILVEELEQPTGTVPAGVLKEHLIVLRLTETPAPGPGLNAACESSTIFLLPKGRELRLPVPSQGRLVLVSLRCSFVEGVALRADLDRQTVSIGDAVLRDPTLAHLILALRAEVLNGCPSGRDFGVSVGSALVLRALQLCSRWASPRDASLQRPRTQMHSVVEHIQTHLAEHNCLQTLAAVARMSPRQFGRLFSQSFGVSPHQYVLRQRVAKAQLLLTETKQSVADIAYAVGFPNQSHFTTMFGKLVGETPKAFRDARHPGWN